MYILKRFLPGSIRILNTHILLPPVFMRLSLLLELEEIVSNLLYILEVNLSLFVDIFNHSSVVDCGSVSKPDKYFRR